MNDERVISNGGIGPATRILRAAALLFSSACFAQGPDAGQLHHIHLNVADARKTQAFYARTLGAEPLHAQGQPALRADDTLLLLNEINDPIRSAAMTGIYHLGWARMDGPSEAARLSAAGVTFHTPIRPFQGGHYMYFHGPDREVIEIWTARQEHRFNHVHLLSSDPKQAAQWFAMISNATDPTRESGPPPVWSLRFGAVTLDILPDVGALRPAERSGAIEPTDGAGIDHLAFGFRDLEATLARVQRAGIAIERPATIDKVSGVKSFFVRSPDGVLVEMLELKTP